MAGPLLTAYIEVRAKADSLKPDIEAPAKAAGQAAGQAAGREFGRSYTQTAASGASGVNAEMRKQGVQAGNSLVDGVKQSSRKLSETTKALYAAGGAAAGAALAAGIATNLEFGSANAKLRAQLGLTKTDSAAYGKAAGQIYAQNWGGSIDDVNAGLVSVKQNLTGLADTSLASLRKLTPEFLAFSDVYGKGVEETTRSVSQLLRTGLAPNAQAALDVLTKGFQSGLNSADDLLDTVDEYSTVFRQLGLSGQDAFGLLQQGVKAGARDTDTLADALKELTIRASDGTAAAGFKLIGVNAQQMRDAIVKGGPPARAALDEILDGIASIQDPAKRSQAALGLFGTKAEDLQGALKGLDLDTAASQFGATAGAAKRMSDAVGDSPASKIEAYRRKLQLLTAEAVKLPGPLGDGAAGVIAFGGDALTAAGSIAQIVTALRGVKTAQLLAAGATDVDTTAVLANTKALQWEAIAAGEAAGATGIAGAAGAGAAAAGGRFLGKVGGFFGGIGAAAGKAGLLESAGKIGLFKGAGLIGVGGGGKLSQDKVFAGLVKEGHADEAAKSFKLATEEMKKFGQTEDQVRSHFPLYTAAVAAASGATKENAAATTQASTRADLYAASLHRIPARTVSNVEADISQATARVAEMKRRLADPHLTNPEKTKLRADISAAQARIRQLKGELNSIPDQTVHVMIAERLVQSAAVYNSGIRSGIQLRAAGGPVYGPGTETSDSIDARLSNNEHIWTAAEVRGAGGHVAVERLRKQALGGLHDLVHAKARLSAGPRVSGFGGRGSTSGSAAGSGSGLSRADLDYLIEGIAAAVARHGTDLADAVASRPIILDGTRLDRALGHQASVISRTGRR